MNSHSHFSNKVHTSSTTALPAPASFVETSAADVASELPKLTISIPNIGHSPSQRKGSPEMKQHSSHKKASSNALFNILDVIVNSELTCRVNPKYWVNQANIVTPDYKKSTFGPKATSSPKPTDSPSGQTLHCKRTLDFDNLLKDKEAYKPVETPVEEAEAEEASSDEDTDFDLILLRHQSLE